MDQNLVWPVTLTVVNADFDSVPRLLDGVDVRLADRHPEFAWAWYPSRLPHFGVGGAAEEEPRLWFAGSPQGQELGVFDTLITAVGRRQRLLSPATEAAARAIDWPLHVAVLTTPA